MADLPPLPPEGTPFLDTDTGRMNQLWRAWFRRFAPILATVAEQISGIEGDLGDLGALSLSDDWTDYLAKVADGTITVQIEVPFSGTITSTISDCDSGTCSARVRINGVDVGTQSNSVSTTKQTRTHSAANTFEIGDLIEYVISGNAACLGMRFQINYSRPLTEPS